MDKPWFSTKSKTILYFIISFKQYPDTRNINIRITLRRKKSISCEGRLNECVASPYGRSGLSMFGMGAKVKNPGSVKIMIVNTEEPEAIEKLSSYVSEMSKGKKKKETTLQYSQD